MHTEETLNKCSSCHAGANRYLVNNSFDWIPAGVYTRRVPE